MIKLATFITNIQHNGMDLSTQFTNDDWLAELRKILTYCIEEDKQSCYVVDEYRVPNDLWYRDLECIAKAQTSSEVIRHRDLLASLTALMIREEQKVREKQLGISKSGSAQQYSQAAMSQASSDARLAKKGASKLMKTL